MTRTDAGRRAQWAGLAAMLLLLLPEASAQGMPRPARERGNEAAGTQRMVPATRPSSFVADDETQARRGRLSPEERRQLRRDVHEAGRDLYPERTRAARREQRRE